MALLKEREADYPPGVQMQVITDVADTVRDNLTLTFSALRDAVLLVLMALLLFLGRWRLPCFGSPCRSPWWAA